MKYSDYIERKQHGTPEFPIEYYYVDFNHMQYHMPLHWHNEFEIVRVLSGSLTLYLNDEKYVLLQGDMAFVECGTLHRATPSDSIYECIVLDMNMLLRRQNSVTDSLIKRIMNNECSILHKAVINRKIGDILNQLFDCFHEENPYLELTVYSKLYELFFLLYKEKEISDYPKIIKRHSDCKTIAKLIDYMDEHYNEEIKLADLAKVANLSEKYLCRYFRNYTSKTPFEYITLLRINNACYDLLHTNLSVSEIAYRNGFSSASYFSKMFHKLKNTTPKEFLRNSRYRTVK